MSLLNFIPFFSSLTVTAKDNDLDATNYVTRLKQLEDFLMIISFLACMAIVLAFIYFAFRYKRKTMEEQGQAQSHHSLFLEILWSFIPFVLFVVVFVWGWIVYKDFYTPPKNSLEIHVYGQMWNWEFIYKNGRKTSNEFYVPANHPIKLILTSRDVIHSFFIPTFRIKQDAVPGRYTSLWFEANHTGTFQVFCTELCGTGHSAMGAKLHVVSLKKWEEWLKTDPYKGLSMVEIGQKIFKGRCTACHKTTSEKLIGPGLFKIYNTKRILTDGASVLADENYLRESILNPGTKITQGYANQMTPFAGLLSEEELSGLIEYIKSLE